ncbi:MAG: RNA-binding S4 domain-containing protein [Phormidesmis sp.]
MASEFIKLDQFLKVIDAAQSGGEAKLLIRSGEVAVNGDMELRRGRKLYDQDVVTFNDTAYTVEFGADTTHEGSDPLTM